MSTITRPIIATTSLSLLLHGVVLVGLLLVYDQLTILNEGVGSGVEIQLVSSVLVSDQREDDVQRDSKKKSEAKPEVSSASLIHAVQKKFAKNILTSLNSKQAIVVTEPEEKQLIEQNSVVSVAQATNASQQQHAILELLHRRISDNKKYPYLARRQRREGIATVAFLLHPDGKIENTHLVTSSRAAALDRAALTAVKQIEPFTLAQEYLEQAEEFQVDIEFNLR